MNFEKSDLDDAQSILDELDKIYPFWRSDRNLTQGHTLATMLLRAFRKNASSQKLKRNSKSIQLAEQKFYIEKWRLWKQNNQSIMLSLHGMTA